MGELLGTEREGRRETIVTFNQRSHPPEEIDARPQLNEEEVKDRLKRGSRKRHPAKGVVV